MRARRPDTRRQRRLRQFIQDAAVFCFADINALLAQRPQLLLQLPQLANASGDMTGDLKGSVAALARVSQTCVACHAAYRIQ